MKCNNCGFTKSEEDCEICNDIKEKTLSWKRREVYGSEMIKFFDNKYGKDSTKIQGILLKRIFSEIICETCKITLDKDAKYKIIFGKCLYWCDECFVNS